MEKTKKFWILFTLLTLLPILIGLTVGLMVVRFGKQGFVDEALLEQCREDLNTVTNIKQELEDSVQQYKELHQSPLAAQRELDELKIELDELYQHTEVTTVDSIENGTLQKIAAIFGNLEKEYPTSEVPKALTTFYQDKAIMLGWKAKKSISKEKEIQSRNAYVQSLELELHSLEQNLRDATDALGEAKQEIRNQLATISVLKSQLENKKGSSPRIATECDHSACELEAHTALQNERIQYLKRFITDLSDLDQLTDWFGDKNIRKQLTAKKNIYQKQLDETKFPLKENKSEW